MKYKSMLVFFISLASAQAVQVPTEYFCHVEGGEIVKPFDPILKLNKGYGSLKVAIGTKVVNIYVSPDQVLVNAVDQSVSPAKLIHSAVIDHEEVLENFPSTIRERLGKTSIACYRGV